MNKPIVPQFVADWYEANQDNFEFNLYLYRLCVDYYNCDLDTEMMMWFRDKYNNPIQTLTAMHQLGYEVKKEERLYTVEFPQTDSDSHILLRKSADGRVGLDLNYDHNWAAYSTYWLTEDEIRKDFDYAWKYAKVVK